MKARVAFPKLQVLGRRAKRCSGASMLPLKK